MMDFKNPNTIQRSNGHTAFEVLLVVTMKCTIFWDGSCVVYQDYMASHFVMGTHYNDEKRQSLGLKPYF
jgi:hypothetical protein